jgi:hypothetical protein
MKGKVINININVRMRFLRRSRRNLILTLKIMASDRRSRGHNQKSHPKLDILKHTYYTIANKTATKTTNRKSKHHKLRQRRKIKRLKIFPGAAVPKVAWESGTNHDTPTIVFVQLPRECPLAHTLRIKCIN